MRIDLHDAHHAQCRSRRDDAVGIERDREFVVVTPALAEVADVAGLEPGIDLAQPVRDADAAIPILGHRPEQRRLGGGDLWIGRVAQDVEVEAAALAARGKVFEQRREIARDACGRLIADADGDGGRGRDRLVPADEIDMRMTAATGLAVNRIRMNPMTAFQKPITNQGSQSANRTSIRMSRPVSPPGASAAARKGDEPCPRPECSGRQKARGGPASA